MTRELKFRAWDEDQKKFHTFGLWGLDGEFHVEDLCMISDMPIEQFTGLKDKNGKEIYEGDIVRGYSVGVVGLIPTVGEIKFREATFMLGDFNLLGGAEWQFFEVIGNIHQNPELLE